MFKVTHGLIPILVLIIYQNSVVEGGILRDKHLLYENPTHITKLPYKIKKNIHLTLIKLIIMKELTNLLKRHRLCSTIISVFNNKSDGNLFICNSGSNNSSHRANIKLPGFKTQLI